MNRDTLKQIMIDQKESYLNNPLIPRKYFLEENVNYCFVGIRRTGKSYMMYQKIQSLIEKGVPVSQIVYVNFEDERLLEITSDDLNIILEIGIELSGTANRPYLFFDEIQNIDGWEKFVRRMADMKYRIDITGSNSKMLSNEIASTLGGRFVILNVYPYSFSEYLVANHKDKNYLNVISTKDRAEVLSLYHEYITYGAFPELVDIRNKRSFLNSIYQTVYLGDIITRNKITNDFAVRLILKKIAESVTKPLSFSRLTNILKNAGASLGKQTVINYVGYMTDSYLLFTLRNYAAKLIEKETSPKYYFMDTGLLGLMLYHEYITYGAFPELVDIRNKRSFLNSIYQTVYLGDIITRNKITNDFAVRLILKKIAESVTKPLSFSRLTNILKNAGASLGKQTVINYVGYMTDSYLLFTLRNYAAKLIEKETSPKYYFMDTGLLGLMLLDCQSAQLENLVAIELVRRYGIENVYFFENNVEIDFYVPSEQLAIQVSMQILDNIDTKERETKAFTKLKNFIPDITCLLITNSEEAVLECNDIVIDVVPAWKWLLDAADTSSH